MFWAGPNVTTDALTAPDTSPILFTVDFGEAVLGFGVAAITVTNGSTSNVNSTGNGTFTFDVTPDGNGDVTVSIAGGGATGVTDVAGNPTNASNTVTLPFTGGL